MHAYTYAYMCIHMHTDTYICIQTHIHIYTYTHTHTHIHIYIYRSPWPRTFSSCRPSAVPPPATTTSAPGGSSAASAPDASSAAAAGSAPPAPARVPSSPNLTDAHDYVPGICVCICTWHMCLAGVYAHVPGRCICTCTWRGAAPQQPRRSWPWSRPRGRATCRLASTPARLADRKAGGQNIARHRRTGQQLGYTRDQARTTNRLGGTLHRRELAVEVGLEGREVVGLGLLDQSVE